MHLPQRQIQFVRQIKNKQLQFPFNIHKQEGKHQMIYKNSCCSFWVISKTQKKIVPWKNYIEKEGLTALSFLTDIAA